MNRNKQIVKYSLFGILLNVFLSLSKAIVGIFALSISIILDAVNNLTDALSSIITIIGVKLANKRPDKKHPYGHGRIEYLTSLIIGVIILITGGASLYESILKIINPVQATYEIYTIIIMVVGIILKVVFGLLLRNKAKTLQSGALKASGTDALGDAILTSSVLISVIISLIWNVSLEGYLGVVISLFIIKTGFSIIKDATSDILGSRSDPEQVTMLKDIIKSFDNVLGVYDCNIHNYGPLKSVATAHIEVPDDLTAKTIHNLIRRIQIKVYEELGMTLTLGIYASNNTGKAKEIKDYLIDILQNYTNLIQFHGFYFDESINLVTFDLIFSFDEEDVDTRVKEIKNLLKLKYPDYYFSIIIDTDISE